MSRAIDNTTTAPTARTGETILATDDLTKQFGTLTAVNGVTLDIPRDEITSIIGPNGAGKTTLFNLFTGKHEPTRGRIEFRGERIDGVEPYALVNRGIVRSFQINNFFDDLTTLENVRLATQAPRTGFGFADFFAHHDSLDEATEEAMDVLDRVDLVDVAETKAANLSYGQRRHLEIGISLAADPDLLLMDEPTAGMSPEETRETVELIKEVAADISLVLIEHDMEIVMGISDNVAVMNDGELLSWGSPETIQNDERVQEAYLGGGE